MEEQLNKITVTCAAGVLELNPKYMNPYKARDFSASLAHLVKEGVLDKVVIEITNK